MAFCATFCTPMLDLPAYAQTQNSLPLPCGFSFLFLLPQRLCDSWARGRAVHSGLEMRGFWGLGFWAGQRKNISKKDVQNNLKNTEKVARELGVNLA